MEIYTAQARWVADHILNNFLAATRSDTGQCRGTPTIGETPPSCFPSTDLRIHTTERCGWPSTLAIVSAQLYRSICGITPAQYAVDVTSAGVVHGKSWGCQCAHTLSSCFQGRIIIRLLSPPRLPKKSKDQPLHTITSAKHQPNISQTPSGRIISGCLHSVYLMSWHDFQPMLSSFLPFFLSSTPMFHSPTRAEVMTPSSNQSRVTVFTCFCTISAWMWWKSSGATKDVVALQILSDHLKNLEVGLMGCEWSVLFPRSETGRH